MKFIKKTLIAGAAFGSVAAGVLPLTGTGAATLYNYEHGVYSQAHWDSKANCEAAKKNTLKVLANYGATTIKAGECHYINANEDGVKRNGWLFDTTYKRALAVWRTDIKLPNNANASTAQKSFKFNGLYASKNEAVKIEADRFKRINATAGMKITWRSGVVQNPTTKKWGYELNYNSRTPYYYAHTQISEKVNVTTPSLKANTPVVIVPNPPGGHVTTPTTTTNPNTGTVIDKEDHEAIGVQGLDLSGHTIVNDWEAWKEAGVKFVYIKATESNTYRNPSFSTQYNGATNNSIIRGAYHFANPEFGSGSSQANFFINNGGGWSNDGRTLPGVLDMEWNPYGQSCYNKTPEQLRTYVTDFVNTYKNRTGVYPIIYTATYWWNQCIGGDFKTPASLWIASYKTSPGTLPKTWNEQTVWQNSAVSSKGYDTDVFNGTLTQLRKYATTGITPQD